MPLSGGGGVWFAYAAAVARAKHPNNVAAVDGRMIVWFAARFLGTRVARARPHLLHPSFRRRCWTQSWPI
jgi:hypothetical protein